MMNMPGSFGCDVLTCTKKDLPIVWLFFFVFQEFLGENTWKVQVYSSLLTVGIYVFIINFWLNLYSATRCKWMQLWTQNF